MYRVFPRYRFGYFAQCASIALTSGPRTVTRKHPADPGWSQLRILLAPTCHVSHTSPITALRSRLAAKTIYPITGPG